MGSCINPFIYATTIPGFKKIVKNNLIRCGCIRGELSQLTQLNTNDIYPTKPKDNNKQELILIVN